MALYVPTRGRGNPWHSEHNGKFCEPGASIDCFVMPMGVDNGSLYDEEVSDIYDQFYAAKSVYENEQAEFLSADGAYSFTQEIPEKDGQPAMERFGVVNPKEMASKAKAGEPVFFDPVSGEYLDKGYYVLRGDHNYRSDQGFGSRANASFKRISTRGMSQKKLEGIVAKFVQEWVDDPDAYVTGGNTCFGVVKDGSSYVIGLYRYASNRFTANKYAEQEGRLKLYDLEKNRSSPLCERNKQNIMKDKDTLKERYWAGWESFTSETDLELIKHLAPYFMRSDRLEDKTFSTLPWSAELVETMCQARTSSTVFYNLNELVTRCRYDEDFIDQIGDDGLQAVFDRMDEITPEENHQAYGRFLDEAWTRLGTRQIREKMTDETFDKLLRKGVQYNQKHALASIVGVEWNEDKRYPKLLPELMEVGTPEQKARMLLHVVYGDADFTKEMFDKYKDQWEDHDRRSVYIEYHTQRSAAAHGLINGKDGEADIDAFNEERQRVKKLMKSTCESSDDGKIDYDTFEVLFQAYLSGVPFEDLIA